MFSIPRTRRWIVLAAAFVLAAALCAGSLALSASLPGSVSVMSLGAWTLAAPASRDMEQFTNVLAERVAYQIGTNTAGSWFSVTKLVPWAKPDPFAIVRGTN